jgi:hypothetical protein
VEPVLASFDARLGSERDRGRPQQLIHGAQYLRFGWTTGWSAPAQFEPFRGLRVNLRCEYAGD